MELLSLWVGLAATILGGIGAIIKISMSHATAMQRLNGKNDLQDQVIESKSKEFEQTVTAMRVDYDNRILNLKNGLDNTDLDLASMQAHNAKQHEELYLSRNQSEQAITKLSTIMEMMVHKQDTMDAKLDMLLQRRSNND